MAQVHRPWVAGVCDGSGDVFDVRSPFDGALVGRVAVTTPEQTERAVAAAAAVAPAFAGLPAAARAAALTHVSAQLTRRAAEVVDLICAESGKPITWARIEAGRAAVLVSFTGCGPVGWGIRAAVPAKHVTLELGGNAAVLVAPDWSSEATCA